jgi:hypothetical protein
MWFKVKEEDLVPCELATSCPEQTKIRTRDVEMFEATARPDQYSVYSRKPYVTVNIITRTNATDAFRKTVDELMDNKDFDPCMGYTISVRQRTVKEPV